MNYTAAPTVTYPDHVRVYNANKKLISLGDGECLTANDAGSASSYTGGSSYVARYEKSSGMLYLKDYHGVAADDMIFADGDLNIEVVSNSSFTTSTTATGNLYGIRADSGKLNISGSGKLTVTAKGRGNVYGISAKEGVTISAPLAVTVEKNNVAENGPVYGIYAQSGAISLDGNDMIVTATGGTENAYGVYNAADTSTTITDNGNIGISGTLTVNLSNGSYNRGINSQGGVITLDGATVKIPGSYYYGIFNDNGNVVIKSNSDVDISSDISSNNGICTDTGGDLTIENSTVKVSANGFAAEIKGNVSVKDSTVELTRTSSYYEVIRTGNSSAANTIDLSGTGSVTLTASGEQTNYAMITGKVTLGPNTKYEIGKPDGNSYDGAYDAASDKTVLKFVHESAAPTTYTVSFDANGGSGTMPDVTDISGEYTLPTNGFTAPDGKQFKAWRVGGVEKAVGDKITVTANTTVTAVWEAVEYNVTVTDGTAKDGAGNEVSTNDSNRSVAAGTEITITANAAPEDYAFDKWEVVRGNVTFADATSQVTTFNMPGENVEVKATYKHINHTYGGWESDGTNHWKECTCGYKTEPEEHSYNSVVTAKATTRKNGTVEKECSVCGYRTTDTIYYPKTIKLQATNYTYNGKVNKPSVSIIDANGNTVSSANYNVSYATGRKNVGRYKVTVTFKGDKYSGSTYTYFNINPKGTSISKVTGAKKAFTVKWKKQSSKMATSTITGYQIRYSTSSKMTSAKTKTVKGYKSTSKKITKLSAKKKYYLQVRTYKTVSGKTYYSSWSGVKSVKTK